MRRKMTRSTFLLGIGGAAALTLLGTRAASQTARPNVLWVITDDQPQYMMDPMPVTRREIRDKGGNFVLGHADIPLCGPARTSLLTGLSVTTHGCNTNTTWGKFEGSPLALGERIVASYMKGAGYATGHFGKYVNGHFETHSVPPCWDVWRECTDNGEQAGLLNIDGSVQQLGPYAASSLWAARECAAFIHNRQGGPWFAQYCPTIPHSPYTPSRASEHLYDGAKRRSPAVNEKDMSDKPKWMRDLKPADRWWTQKAFEGKKEELADLDRRGIRPILAALEATGQLRNTVIFFTSDNGYLHGEHRLRSKDHPYWESSEVPFFVKGPGVRQAHRVALVNHTDLMPTTCEIAGIPFSSLDVDGRSMLANLGRDYFINWRKRMLVSGSNDLGPGNPPDPNGPNLKGRQPSGLWWLLREGNTAFILRENGAKELYFMRHDPHQLRSKAWSVEASVRDRLTNIVKAMRAASGQERRRLEEV